jgi:hypothetical protein
VFPRPLSGSIDFDGAHGFVDVTLIVADRVHGADTPFISVAVDAQVVPMVVVDVSLVMTSLLPRPLLLPTEQSGMFSRLSAYIGVHASRGSG